MKCDNWHCLLHFSGKCTQNQLPQTDPPPKGQGKGAVRCPVQSTICLTSCNLLPPGHRTCSFISHLNSPGSIQPSCHFWRTELLNTQVQDFNYCPTRYPLTPGSRECMCEQSAFPRNTTSEHIQCSQGLNLRSLTCTSCMLPLSHMTPCLSKLFRSSQLVL